MQNEEQVRTNARYGGVTYLDTTHYDSLEEIINRRIKDAYMKGYLNGYYACKSEKSIVVDKCMHHDEEIQQQGLVQFGRTLALEARGQWFKSTIPNESFSMRSGMKNKKEQDVDQESFLLAEEFSYTKKHIENNISAVHMSSLIVEAYIAGFKECYNKYVNK